MLNRKSPLIQLLHPPSHAVHEELTFALVAADQAFDQAILRRVNRRKSSYTRQEASVVNHSLRLCVLPMHGTGSGQSARSGEGRALELSVLEDCIDRERDGASGIPKWDELMALNDRSRRGAPSKLADSATMTMAEYHNSPDIASLVRQAAAGDKAAWERLVDQYSRLIWAMTRDFRLSEVDAADVVQTTWLRLLENIGRIEYPERVGSWLATTARHECLRHLAARNKVMLVDDHDATFGHSTEYQPEVDERLLAKERALAVREALSTLSGRSQQLLELLMADPPVSYTEISDQLGLPIGSIGPTRGRCLERLRVILQPV